MLVLDICEIWASSRMVASRRSAMTRPVVSNEVFCERVKPNVSDDRAEQATLDSTHLVADDLTCAISEGHE